MTDRQFSVSQPPLAGLGPTSQVDPAGTIGGDPKLQLSNGYYLRFDQLSRILGSIAGRQHQSLLPGLYYKGQLQK